MNVHTIALVAAVLIPAGCRPAAVPTGGKVATAPPGAPVPPAPPISDHSSTDASNPQAALVAAYRAAHERKDVEAIVKLYCLDGASADVREVTRENIAHELRHPIANIQIAPAPLGSGTTDEGGIRWRPSLPEIAHVTVDYDTSRKAPGEYAVQQAVLSVGMKRGRCYFTVPVRDN